jgi:beta-glucosidase
MAGAEIVQCYIQDEFASAARPVRELADFKKIFLQPGESLEVKMQISPSAMSFYDINMNYSMEKGRFKVFVGKDSDAPLAGTFRL